MTEKITGTTGMLKSIDDFVLRMIEEDKEDPRVEEMAGSGIFMIKCGKCGHVNDIELFTIAPMSGSLPNDTYQCPACGTAIRRVCKNGTISHIQIPEIW